MQGSKYTISELRAAIIADAKSFLIGLDSGASGKQLQAMMQRIREKEMQLLKEEGVLLDPRVWKILHSRLINRNETVFDPGAS